MGADAAVERSGRFESPSVPRTPSSGWHGEHPRAPRAQPAALRAGVGHGSGARRRAGCRHPPAPACDHGCVRGRHGARAGASRREPRRLPQRRGVREGRGTGAHFAGRGQAGERRSRGCPRAARGGSPTGDNVRLSLVAGGHLGPNRGASARPGAPRRCAGQRGAGPGFVQLHARQERHRLRARSPGRDSRDRPESPSARGRCGELSTPRRRRRRSAAGSTGWCASSRALRTPSSRTDSRTAAHCRSRTPWRSRSSAT